jgi:hypothetical protein
MGFDFENGRFTPEHAEVLPAQTVTLIGELEPGDIYYIPSEAVWVSNEDRKLWINGSSPAYSAKDLCDLGEFGDIRDYARIVCINEGLIVDFSHLAQYSWFTLEERWERSGGPRESQLFEGTMKPLPVIHIVHNLEELELIEPVLEQQYNIVLQGSELGPLLAAVLAILEADEDEAEESEEVLDDESDEGEDLAA